MIVFKIYWVRLVEVWYGCECIVAQLAWSHPLYVFKFSKQTFMEFTQVYLGSLSYARSSGGGGSFEYSFWIGICSLHRGVWFRLSTPVYYTFHYYFPYILWTQLYMIMTRSKLYHLLLLPWLHLFILCKYARLMEVRLVNGHGVQYKLFSLN